MLMRFGVANHRSIRDYQELLLSASRSIKREGLTIPAPVVREAAVPIAAIYGPNASGKSNLIDAMRLMRILVVSSHAKLGAADQIPRVPFLLDRSGNEPTRLDCTFSTGPPESAGPAAIYEYGFEFTDTEFRREWLYRIVRKERQSTQLLFERAIVDGKVTLEFGNRLRGANKTIAGLVRPNSLFLSAAAQNNHPQLQSIFRYFSSFWEMNRGSNTVVSSKLVRYLSDTDLKESFLNLLRQADVGIVDFNIEKTEPDPEASSVLQGILQTVEEHGGSQSEIDVLERGMVDAVLQPERLRFIHSCQDRDAPPFDYDMESRGTLVLISLLIPALNALTRGALLVVDELNTSLHPNLSRAFVSLFNREDSNRRGAQLVFSTHDVSLLGSGVLENDEIWLAEKDDEGVSRFTPLTDFKVRSRDDIEKAYRRGRLGGVPFADDFFIDLSDDPAPSGP